MIKSVIFAIFFILLIGCGSDGSNSDSSSSADNNGSYTIHKNITATTFWVGENASSENKEIPNLASAWDDEWTNRYGGIDDPESRDGYYPSSFIPKENPFYFALPYNDFDENGEKKSDIDSYIPWATSADSKTDESVCKNRWIKIIKNSKVAYAQWEDVGPFGEDDKNYVFGNTKPESSINNYAGLDLSPAVRDYLGLDGEDKVDWQFIDEKDVPDGAWKKIITVTNVNWN